MSNREVLHSHKFGAEFSMNARELSVHSNICTGSECSPRTDLWRTGICLIYWHDIKLSLAVLASLVLLQVAFILNQTVCVVAYLSLSTLSVVFSYCCCYGFAGLLQNSSHPHPFRKYLDRDIHISKDTIYRLAEFVASIVTWILEFVKEIIFLKETKSSLKFYVLLWLLLPIGRWFSSTSLILIVTVGLFTLPKFYLGHKAQVDNLTMYAEHWLTVMFSCFQQRISTFRRAK